MKRISGWDNTQKARELGSHPPPLRDRHIEAELPDCVRKRDAEQRLRVFIPERGPSDVRYIAGDAPTEKVSSSKRDPAPLSDEFFPVEQPEQPELHEEKRRIGESKMKKCPEDTA